MCTPAISLIASKSMTPVEAANQHLGDIDVLVNCAGMAPSAPFHKITCGGLAGHLQPKRQWRFYH